MLINENPRHRPSNPPKLPANTWHRIHPFHFYFIEVNECKIHTDDFLPSHDDICMIERRRGHRKKDSTNWYVIEWWEIFPVATKMDNLSVFCGSSWLQNCHWNHTIDAIHSSPALIEVECRRLMWCDNWFSYKWESSQDTRPPPPWI